VQKKIKKTFLKILEFEKQSLSLHPLLGTRYPETKQKRSLDIYIHVFKKTKQSIQVLDFF